VTWGGIGIFAASRRDFTSRCPSNEKFYWEKRLAKVSAHFLFLSEIDIPKFFNSLLGHKLFNFSPDKLLQLILFLRDSVSAITLS